MSNTLDYAFFYPSQGGDRKYNATSFEYWLKKFFTTGVFEGDLQVTANDDMTVTIGAGYCNVDGKVRFFQNATILPLDTANATYNRIDTVVAERNDTERNISIKVITGGHATEPIPTAPVRENGVYQLVLAQIYVAAGAVMITQEDITDTRTDQTICGVVTGTVKEYNFDQFKVQFDKWFASVKDTLSDDAAGNLLNLIGELDNLETEAKDSLVAAINEVFNMAPDTVDPMVATESGFAADALATKNALDEQNKNCPFAFGIDENGNYGYIKEGADTVTPFLGYFELFSVLVDDNQFEYDVIVLRSSVRNLKITSNRSTVSQSLKVGYCNSISVQSPYRYKATDFVAITTLDGNLTSNEVDIASIPSDAKYIVIKPVDTYAKSIKLECNY